MSENTQHQWRHPRAAARAEQLATISSAYDGTIDDVDLYGDGGDDDDDDDGGGGDHIDYMLDHGRLQATCHALESALAATSQKLRDVDARASVRIRALEAELRVAMTTSRQRQQQQPPPSAAAMTTSSLPGRSPSPTSLESGTGDHHAVGTMVEEGGSGSGRTCGDDGLLRLWADAPSSSRQYDECDDDDRQSPRAHHRHHRHHRRTMVLRRLLPRLSVAVAAAAVTLLLAATIALSARSARRSDEAFALAARAEAEAAGSTIGGGVVASSALGGEEGAGTTATAGDGGFAGGYYLVGMSESSSESESESESESLSLSLSPSSPSSPSAAPSPPASAPAAVWYSTTHRHYQEILKHKEYAGNATATAAAGAGGIDTHVVAEMFCRESGMVLCDYGSYCPGGRGHAPYGGGPTPADVDATTTATPANAQWAPFLPRQGGGRATMFGDAASPRDWVQVGAVSADGGGADENDHARCWTYADWSAEVGGGGGGGGASTDIEEVWEGRHRLWMLCCPTAED